jgi:hypothetical protein
MSELLNHIFSHYHVLAKNKLVIALIEEVCDQDAQLTEELTAILSDLTTLNKTENAKVALKARQVLIASITPSYELRHNQVESIFISAIDQFGNKFSPENLQKLIMSETSIYDVLQDFFFHPNVKVRMAALEVYIRRAYIAYELTCMQHQQLPSGNCIVLFQFLLPSTHPNRVSAEARQLGINATSPLNKLTSLQIPRVASLSDEIFALADSSLPCQRMGAITAFPSFDTFKAQFDAIMEQFTTCVFPDVKMLREAMLKEIEEEEGDEEDEDAMSTSSTTTLGSTPTSFVRTHYRTPSNQSTQSNPPALQAQQVIFEIKGLLEI